MNILTKKEFQNREKQSQFAKVKVGDIVLMNKQLLFEILEKRLKDSSVKIDDLFLLCRAPNGLEGDQKVETPFGMLRVFFINKDLKSSWLLHKSKYDYPKISKISSRGSHKISTLDPTKIDIDKLAKDALKENFKVH